MNKDWNYAHMWDTMRRALEEREKHRIREMQTMFDVEIVPYKNQAEGAKE